MAHPAVFRLAPHVLSDRIPWRHFTPKQMEEFLTGL
jgi:hypothetical protein